MKGKQAARAVVSRVRRTLRVSSPSGSVASQPARARKETGCTFTRSDSATAFTAATSCASVCSSGAWTVR